MKPIHTLGLVAIAVIAATGIYFALPAAPAPETETVSEQSNGKLDMNAVCEGALAYMTFPDGESADAFVAKCKDGEHPEVIERYQADMNLGAGAAI